MFLRNLKYLSSSWMYSQHEQRESVIIPRGISLETSHVIIFLPVFQIKFTAFVGCSRTSGNHSSASAFKRTNYCEIRIKISFDSCPLVSD